jgi:Flp pilus assembly protein TadD
VAGNILHLNLGDASGAVVEYQLALQGDESDALSYMNLGKALLTLNNTSGAQEAFSSAMLHHPPPRAVMVLAMICMDHEGIDFEHVMGSVSPGIFDECGCEKTLD